MNRLFLLLLALILVSCQGTYKVSVCHEKNRIDLDGFVGQFSVNDGVTKTHWNVSQNRKHSKGQYLVQQSKDDSKKKPFPLAICQIEEHLIAEYPLTVGLVNQGELTHAFVSKTAKGFELSPLNHFKDAKNSIIIFDNSKITIEEFVKFTFENKRSKSNLEFKRL